MNATNHSFDPRIRVALAALTVLTAALLPKYQFERFFMILAAESALLCALAAGGAVRARVFVSIMAATLPASALLSSTAMFRAGHPLVQLGGGFVLSSEGVALAFGLFLASVAASLAIALVAATTNAALARRALASLGAPAAAISLFTFLHRQAAVATGEVDRIRRAAALRGAGTRGRLAFLAVRGNITSVWVNSLERGARLDRALLARGFDGAIPSPPLPSLSRRDAVVGAFGATALLLLLLLP